MSIFLIRYIISLVFGTLLTYVFGAIPIKKNWKNVFGILGFLFFLEVTLYSLFGMKPLLNTYPLHTHFMLVIFLVFVHRIHFYNAMMYVMLAYMSCQVPAWISKFSQYLFPGNELAEIIVYFIIVVITAELIIHTVGDSAKELFGQNLGADIGFGLIPVTYYVFDYVTTVWTDLLYSGNYHITQFIPFVLCIGYLVFMVTYRSEQKKKTQAFEDKVLIERNLELIENEIESIREIERMARIYRHDMRHHFHLLLSMLQDGKTEQAESYIKENIHAVQEITPKRYCEIDMLNLLLTHYGNIAEGEHIKHRFEVKLSETLPISNMEICALVSNALENACQANMSLPEEKRNLELVFKEHNGMLIFSVDNACEEQQEIFEVDPSTDWYKEHGIGTKSIEAIAKKYNGSVSFSAKDGTFRTMVAIRIS